ncbi:SMC family ATPase [Amycolatopsis sp. K13G38]|uniref:Nuclease SbcCD subunit C n=1 Tax=Amycolatopsis acididurans TaxID=2724524 RepID=A0ABX1JLC2_9PSEU|nr:SMC family ATPase [Amycolatopsis acididurans]NKQ59062.1 SMC family ATPase [Amycolatopsis acididurans]
MRPVELSLTGFRSYPSQVTVDFTGKSLAAALGDTGAGKSSLLDAITYALFRKSSWDAREVRLLIADGAEAMSVEFTFLHHGHRWKVQRTMHAKNPNAGRHHLINLDTGHEEDGASAVDVRIKTVLGMGYDTFLRVGLLPQGKFDQLLTAPPKDRNERLRELFGTDALESVRTGAIRHRESLTDLLAEARIKRQAMPDDPAQTAEAAGAAAGAAEAAAERLGSAIDTVSSLQKEAIAAAKAADEADGAAGSLGGKAVGDAASILDALEPVAADFSARRESLNSRAAAADERDGALTTKIEDIEAQGEGPDELAKAAAVVAKLATQAEDQRGERDRLAMLNTELAAEADAIATAGTALTRRAELAKPLTDLADAAAAVNKRLHTLGLSVRAHVTEATAAAQQVAVAAQAHSAAVKAVDAAQQAVTPSEEKALAAENRLTETEEKHDALRLRHQAAALASEVHPGDNCPVCRRRLPSDFEVDAGASAAELARARALVREAKADGQKAARELAEAGAAVKTAISTASGRAKDHRLVEQNAQRATETALQLLAEFASVAVEAEETFDAETASATLTAATIALATRSGDSSPDPAQLTESIVAALATGEDAVAARAEGLRADEIRETAAIEADIKALSGRRAAHQKAVKAAGLASARHTRAVGAAAAELGALPRRIGALLPDDAIDVSAVAAAVAAETIAARLEEVKELVAARDAVRSEKNTVLTLQLVLDQEHRTAVDEPLNRLRSRLDGWANAAVQAEAQLPGTSRSRVPQAAAESGIAEIRTFATTLAAAAAELHGDLIETSTAHSARAEAARTRLGEQAAKLSDVDGFNPAAELTDPELLHPVVATRATALKEAKAQRAAEKTAQQQIKPAADLDFAIEAGQARLAALDVLRGELVDAKFLGHLTELNTRALLGIASELLGQLTGLRFGFAETFEIVSRNSGIAHTPSRLSGGEKFLASLALALALAELHSRSGPRLGSLFLDEGFAALDTTALQGALEVLRTHVGGDRLVMVISHLHAVAEAVDDVLWVERGATGSRARWLTPAERDELVQADLVSGLQALA